MNPSSRQTVITRPPDQARAWYVGAVWLAVIAGLFCGVVTAVLLYQHVRYGHDDPMDNARFAALIAQRRAQPDDPALAARLQSLDLQLRNRFFLHRRRTAMGAWLLLGGAIVLVASAKTASTLRRRLPAPQPVEPVAAGGLRAGLGAEHWAVLGLTFVLGAVMAGLVAAPGDPLAGREQARASADRPLPGAEQYRKNWPRFRGPGGAGIAVGQGYPTDWDRASGRNVRWKAPVELPGYNSPIVWGDRLFISGADEQRRMVYCYHVDSGERLWSRPVNAPGGARGKLDILEDTGYAAPTLATDGLRVYAMFASGDLVAFDFEGRQLWARALPIQENAYGLASSLTTDGGRLLVQLDRGEPAMKLSMLYAIDGATGADVWKQRRPVGSSWCSPILIEDPTHGKVIVTVAVGAVVAHAASTGQVAWLVKGIGEDPAPSPVAGGGLVFAISTHEVLLAIRTGGRGDVTASHVAWEYDEDLPDIVSPLCDGQRLYVLDASGMLTCLRAADGKVLYKQEVPGPYNASPTLAGAKLYLFNKQGTAVIVKAGDTFEKVGQADLGEPVFASPAFVNGRIYVRTTRHLWCLEQGAQGPAEAEPADEPGPGEGGAEQQELTL